MRRLVGTFDRLIIDCNPGGDFGKALAASFSEAGKTRPLPESISVRKGAEPLTVDRRLHRTIRQGLLLSVAVSLLGMVWLNARTIRPATFHLLRQADPIYLMLGAAAMAFAWATETWRMQVLLRLSGERVPFRRLLRVVLATFFAASVTPFASGQGPVQVYLLHREGPSVGSATAILSLRVFLTILVFAAGVPLLLLFSVSESPNACTR